jgi:chromosome partitioning protein
MSAVIAFANRKGGVAKTTTCLCLAFFLAERGKRVLMIDNDSQANLTEFFNYDTDELENKEKTIYSAYIDGVALETLVLPGAPALVPASEQLSEMEEALLTNKFVNRATLLKERLASIRHAYDFTLIDCPPALNLLVVNALVAADTLIIPMATDRFAANGVLRILDTVVNVRTKLNPNLRVAGILPTRFSPSLVNDRRNLEEVRTIAKRSRIRMLSPIPRSTVFNAEAKHATGEHAVSPAPAALRHYASLGEELLNGSP